MAGFAVDLGAVSVAVGVEFQVNSYTTGIQGFSSVARESNGDFVVVWHSVGQDGAQHGIFAQRYASAGATIGAEFKVNTITIYAQSYPAVTMDDDGDFVVLWESYVQERRDGGQGPAVLERGRRARRRVPRQPGRDQDYQGYAAVAMNASGAFLVTWSSYGQDGSVQGVFARRYSSTRHGPRRRVPGDGVTGSDQNYPTVDVEPDGDFVVAWQSSGQDGDGLRRLRAPVRELRRGDRRRVPGQLVHDDGPVVPLAVDGLERRLRRGLAQRAPGRLGLRRLRPALHQHRADAWASSSR